jgi:hypothetical protein
LFRYPYKPRGRDRGRRPTPLPHQAVLATTTRLET